MTPAAFALFDTPIGRCAIAWTERGVRAVGLPEASDAALRARLRRKAPDAGEAEPPADIRGVIDDIVALLSGEPRDFSATAFDMDEVPDFNRRVYEIALAIPAGGTMTYGEIAERIGEPGAARAVGRALGENPLPIVVPCHRVLGADGKVGGFSAHGGVETKLRILTIERASTDGARTLFDDDPAFVFQAKSGR